MKILNRICACAIIMLLCINTVSFAKETTGKFETSEKPEAVEMSNTISDISGENCETAVMFLSQLKILKGDENGLYNPKESLTRAEAAVVAVNLLGFNNISVSDSSAEYYKDVPKDEWYAPYINRATELKLVSGNGDNTFRPNDKIATNEYITMLVNAVGYEAIAKMRGGFPGGYLSVAKEIDLLDGMQNMNKEFISRGDVAISAYNALFVKLLDAKYVGDTIEYSKDDSNEMFLNKIFGIEECEGVVISNKFTGINDEYGNTNKNQVTIAKPSGDTIAYDVCNTKASEMLGIYVKYYVKQEGKGDENDLIFIEKYKNHNTIMAIDANNIEKIEKDGNSKVVISYLNENGKTLKINGDIDMSMIFNNKFVEKAVSATNETLKSSYIDDVKSGDYMLIDNDKDNVFDMMFVNSYKNYVINRLYIDDKKFTVKTGTPSEFEVDEASTDYIFEMKKMDKNISIESLNEGDTVTIAQSKNTTGEKVRKIIVSDNSKDVLISEVKNSDDVCTVTIDGEKFNLSKDVNKIPVAGSEYKAYLNFKNEIVYFENAENVESGYMLLTGITKNKGLENSVTAKFVMTDGEIKVADFRSKITFVENGVPSTITDERAHEKLGGDSTGKSSDIHLLKGVIDSKGQVTKIEVAGKTPDGEYYYDDAFTLDAGNLDVDGEKWFFRRDTPNRINGLYAVSNDAVIFSVPQADPTTNMIDKEKIRVGKNMDTFTNNVYYRFNIYDMDKNMAAHAVVSYGLDSRYSKDGALSFNTEICVVDEIVNTLSENGEEMYKIYGLMSGEKVEEVIAKSVSCRNSKGSEYAEGDPRAMEAITNLKRGSIIQYKVNFDGELSEFRILYDSVLDKNRPVGALDWDDSVGDRMQNTEREFKLYKVKTLDGGVISFSIDDKKPVRTLSIKDDQTIYVYD
ncbi:MAG: S-layer homology domain-containing protein, partial [Oscillospiraceae bacterium]